MGSGRLSVVSAYGYARHERTSAPAQANAPLVARRICPTLLIDAASTFATGVNTHYADLRLYDALRWLRTLRRYLPVRHHAHRYHLSPSLQHRAEYVLGVLLLR